MTARRPAGERIPTAALVAAGPFGPRLPSPRVVQAIARGLIAGGAAPPDMCPLEPPARGGGDARELLAALGLPARMRAARAVIVGERSLREPTLRFSLAFELASSARQAGVPCYAVAAENRLDAFDARMLDLQVVLLAGSAEQLAAAGRELARLL